MGNINLKKPKNLKRKSKQSNNKNSRKKRSGPDKFILSFAISMMILGLLILFDASGYQALNSSHKDQFHYVKLQAIWLLAGTIPAMIIYFINYKFLAKLSIFGILGSIGLLIAVLIFGKEINGAKRWFSIGPIPVQPAELLKPIFILYVSAWFGNKKKHTQNQLIVFTALLGIILLLVLLEPDLGTTMILGISGFTIYFLSDNSKKHIQTALTALIILTIIAGLAAGAEEYRRRRIKTYSDLIFTGKITDPANTGYQMQQILIGIGSGGFFGKGFGQSRQKYGYLVENTAFTDSIIAIILEEFGMISGLIFITAWLTFFFKGIKIANNVDNKTGQLLASGLTVWLTMQTFINISANIGLMPLTGIPLPFLTYGGSSTIVTLSGVALLLNISREN